MNDIRNLMDNLQTHMEYREFEAAVRAPTDNWPVLDRLSRSAVGEAPAVASAASGRSLLGRYARPQAAAAEPAGAELRRLPLAEVFALLERAGR